MEIRVRVKVLARVRVRVRVLARVRVRVRVLVSSAGHRRGEERGRE